LIPTLPSTATLGAIFGVSEIAISLFMRARSGSNDKGSLRLIWLVILGSLFAAMQVSLYMPEFSISLRAVYAAGVAVFFAGLGLRWYSIYCLGRFFTVNVAIADDHRLIDSGPYRWIRHPSYTGALLAFTGFGLCIGNWVSLALILLPIGAVFAYRMHVEEAALLAGLGESYRAYCARSKRLIPFLY